MALTKQRRKLIIDRRIWLRGEGGSASRLLRAGDLKMCCVGIYLSACGLTNALLLEKGEATELGYDEENDDDPGELPREAMWLVHEDHNDLYGTNDEPPSDIWNERDREDKITRLFAKHDIDVEYVG